MNFPLMKLNKKNRNILTPQKSYYSEEYCQEHCDLYLTDQMCKGENGKAQHCYRLHAKADHTQDQALAYDIQCPKCGHVMKQIARQNSHTELGLYRCRECND